MATNEQGEKRMLVEELKGKTVLLAASGGLDSCTITHWLAERGIDVVGYTADLGQPDEMDMQDVKARILSCGASDVVVADLKPQIAVAGLQLVQSLARYEGGYWNTTAMARHVLIADIVAEMRSRNLTILGHGATGRGNDQVRFQLAAQMLDPRAVVYAPWRDSAFLDSFGGRKEMIDYCSRHGLPVKATHDAPYSTDSNILGLTHEAGELEELSTPASRIDPGMGVFAADAPEVAVQLEIRFENGFPVQLDGESLDRYQMLHRCNELGGRHAIGIGRHVVENRFVGIKSRGVYEAPGLELLGTCYEFLLQLILDRRARRLFEQTSPYIAEQIYQGYWFDTATQASWRLIEHFNALATGTIRVSLYKGTVSFESAENVPHSLYSADTSSMEDVGEFDHRDSEGFLGVLGVSARALNHSGQSGLELRHKG